MLNDGSSTIIAVSAVSVGALLLTLLPIAHRPTSVGRRWLRRRLSTAGVGMLVGAILSGFVINGLGLDRNGSAAWLIAALTLVGGNVALLFVPVPETPAATGIRRVAESRHLGLNERVPGWVRVATRVTTVAAVCCTVAAVAAPVLREGTVVAPSAQMPLWAFILDPNTLLTAVSATALVLFEIRARRVSSRSTGAQDALDLTADYGLRRDALIDLAAASMLAGGLAIFLAFPTLLDSLGAPSLGEHYISTYRSCVVAVGTLGLALVLVRPFRMRSTSAAAVAQGDASL